MKKREEMDLKTFNALSTRKQLEYLKRWHEQPTRLALFGLPKIERCEP